MLAITSASSPSLMSDLVTPRVISEIGFAIAPCLSNTAYTIVSLSITLSLVKFRAPRLDSVDQPLNVYPSLTGFAGILSRIALPLSTVTDLGKPAALSAMNNTLTSSFLKIACTPVSLLT